MINREKFSKFGRVYQEKDRFEVEDIMHYIYHLMTKNSAEEAFRYINTLSKEAIGEELTKDEAITSLFYVSLTKGTSLFVPHALLVNQSPQSYIVRVMNEGIYYGREGLKNYVKDFLKWEGVEKDQEHIFVGVFEVGEEETFYEDTITFSFEESMEEIKKMIKSSNTSSEHKIGVKHCVYKGFDDMRSALDYILDIHSKGLGLELKTYLGGSNGNIYINFKRDDLNTRKKFGTIKYRYEFFICSKPSRTEVFLDNINISLATQELIKFFGDKNYVVDYLENLLKTGMDIQKNIQEIGTTDFLRRRDGVILFTLIDASMLDVMWSVNNNNWRIEEFLSKGLEELKASIVPYEFLKQKTVSNIQRITL